MVGVRSRLRKIGSSLRISILPICDNGMRCPAEPVKVKSAIGEYHLWHVP